MHPPSRAKIVAYQRHWRGIRTIQDELSKQVIHDHLSLTNVASDAQLASTTVRRFFHRGKGNGQMGYSLFYGPTCTTVFGIASSLGFDVKLEKRK